VKTGWTRTLILWDYGSWGPTAEKSPKRRLIYFVAAPVPARGAEDHRPAAPCQPQPGLAAPVAPYREHFQATFGAVRYEADYRWIAPTT